MSCHFRCDTPRNLLSVLALSMQRDSVGDRFECRELSRFCSTHREMHSLRSCWLVVFILAAMFASSTRGGAQAPAPRVRVRITTRDSQPIPDARVAVGALRVRSDIGGVATFQAPPGRVVATIRKIGFLPDSVVLTLRVGDDTTLTVMLVEQAQALANVTVSSTRSSRRVEDEPTRVEVLGREELAEKVSMSPGNVSMLLNETSGVRVVATGPSLGGASVRIQGLRGRYTQLLSDGLPLFGLSTEGLGILQIPPLDLAQVEVIKGAASALYGPTALGGVVNFISRRPDDTRDLVLNQTSRDATDLIGYDSRRLSRALGVTLLASAHRQRAQDLDHDGWADIVGFERIALRPRIFYTRPDGTTGFATVGYNGERRTGGTLADALTPDGTSAVRSQRTSRVDAGMSVRVPLDNASSLSVRASYTLQARRQVFGPLTERDTRQTAFAEASVSRTRRAHAVVVGLAYQRDAFDEPESPLLSYTYDVPAVFVQHTWSPSVAFGLTTSARVDHHSAIGTIFSPRVSLIARRNLAERIPVTLRLSGGTGAFAPTPLTESTEELSFTRLAARRGTQAERAQNASADIGAQVGGLELNVSTFVSRIDNAVQLIAAAQPIGARDAVLIGVGPPVRNLGAELLLKYRIDEFQITSTYAFLNSTEWDSATGVRRGVPLSPRHTFGAVVSWESEDGARVGLEAYHTGTQSLEDNPYRAMSPAFTLVGALLQRRVGGALLFLNAENLLDVRQTKFDPLLLRRAGLGGRLTTDVWAPLDGRVFNVGIRIDRRRVSRD